MKLSYLFCLVLPLFVGFTFSHVTTPIAPYEIGQEVQDFTLPSVSGKNLSLYDYAGDKGIIMIFMACECPYVHAYEQRIMDLHTEMSAKGFPVLAISSNDAERMKGNSFENMVLRSKDLGFPFEYVHDAKQEILRTFGATKTPEAFVMKRTPKGLELMYAGAIDDSPRNAKNVETDYIRNAVTSIENGTQIDPARTKSIGCGIRALKHGE